MKLQFLCEAADIDCPQSAAQMEIEGIAMDSRRVVAGGMFICIRGLHTDGHAYITRAISSGASCILVERGVEVCVPPEVICLHSDHTRRAAAYLFRAWYGFPDKRLKLIGVTGTNGKTSVTHMVRAILEASLFRCGLIGTVGCESVGRALHRQGSDHLANMTTPDPPELYRMLAEMVKDGVEYVLMEVTSHALALEKLSPLRFACSIFTNLTPEHLDFHGNMDAYADAKAMLFERSDISIVNLDSAYANRMITHSAGRVITCSLSKLADYHAEVAEMRDRGERDGVVYDLLSEHSRIRLFCPISGRFTVMNSMQAAICALQLGLSVKNVKTALSTLCGIKGRMERVRLGIGADFRVLIDYAHTPDALENLLRTAKEFKKRGGRIVLLFGCGGDRDRSKRAVMGKIASDHADYVIVTSDNSRHEEPSEIIRDIMRGIDRRKPHTVIVDRKEAIEYAVKTAKPDDLILLAGKGHEEYEITKTERLPFCEKEIVRAAFEQRGQIDTDDCTETDI